MEILKQNFKAVLWSLTALTGVGLWSLGPNFKAPSYSVTGLQPTGVERAEFRVLSTGRSSSGTVYLNSRPNFREPGNQSVAIPATAGAVDVAAYVGKTVAVTGTPRTNSTTGSKTWWIQTLNQVEVKP